MFLTLIIALHPIFYLHSFYFFLQFPLEMIYFYFRDIQLSRKLFHLLSSTTSIFHLLSVLTIVSFCLQWFFCPEKIKTYFRHSIGFHQLFPPFCISCHSLSPAVSGFPLVSVVTLSSELT